MNLQIREATLEKIAEHLVSDQLTHEVMDRRFRTLNITEPTPTEPDHYKRLGLRPGVDYYVKKPSKRIRLLRAVQTKHQESGSAGVLQLVKTLYPMEEYAENPDEFREFCRGLNRILRFSCVEYRDDGEFHRVTPTRDLTEAERRARAMENKLASRRVHSEVQRYCKAQYMEENYFHAVFEAAKGLAERIREKTGLKIDGVNLIRETFERPKGGFPILAINALETETELNEHDGLTNLIIGAFKLFRNPIAHTPKILWQHDIEDAVDCLTLISFLHFKLDQSFPTGPQ